MLKIMSKTGWTSEDWTEFGKTFAGLFLGVIGLTIAVYLPLFIG